MSAAAAVMGICAAKLFLVCVWFLFVASMDFLEGGYSISSLGFKLRKVQVCNQ